MTAPAEAATWFRLVSVPLENDVAHLGALGDEIGVATSWQLPGVFASNPPDALARVQAKIDSADWGYDPRSGDWAGKAIAAALELDLSDEVQKERGKGILEAWIAAKALPKPSPTTRGRDRDAVVVGNREEGAAAISDLPQFLSITAARLLHVNLPQCSPLRKGGLLMHGGQLTARLLRHRCAAAQSIRKKPNTSQ
jgi:hypothetical protein